MGNGGEGRGRGRGREGKGRGLVPPHMTCLHDAPVWPYLKLAVPVTPDVGKLFSKFERLYGFRFRVTGGTGQTDGRTEYSA